MVDRSHLVDVLPHYLVMLVAVFLALSLLRVTAGDVAFWIELGVVLTIGILYRPLVIALGLAPDPWQ